MTFEPVITTWEQEFTADGSKQRIGASLFSETRSTLRCRHIAGFLTCSLVPPPVFVRAERRETPLDLEFGITRRIALGVHLPIVRVNVHETFRLDSTGTPAQDSAAQALDSLLNDTTYAFGSISNTTRRSRYFAGDVELRAKYRFLESHDYALSAAVVVRLPTGHQDSPNRLFDLSTGDHQTDIEIQVTQELTLVRRLWLNAMLRAGRQQPGTRARRVGPQSTLLIPHAALAQLNWDPGDYAALDVAPMYRFTRTFGVGVTAGYWTKQRDRYSYRSTQDSVDVATRMGAPVSAGVLDAGTEQRWTRLGIAMTYVSSAYEGSFSIERTVNGSKGARVPAATVVRIVMRTSRWPF